jgi:hypothetical protein
MPRRLLGKETALLSGDVPSVERRTIAPEPHEGARKESSLISKKWAQGF